MNLAIKLQAATLLPVIRAPMGRQWAHSPVQPKGGGRAISAC